MIRLAVRCRPEQAELVLGELAVLAPNGFEEEHGAGYVEYAIYGAEGELPDLGQIEAATGEGTVEVDAIEVPDDWADRWQDFHQPLLVSDRVWVRPSWAEPHPEAIDVVIDPGRAFGTGAHATTRMCIEALVEVADDDGAAGALIDLGTGSGVLAIAAAKLYGGWEGVNGLANADRAHTAQVDQAGAEYACLKQLDVNLTFPGTCQDAAHGITNSAFTNNWFTIDNFIPATATTCPKGSQAFSFPNGIKDGARDAAGNLIGLPGGCTRDLVHKFYQEQYQLNGGAQNRYMVGSDSVGTAMGVYDTKALPIYRYLHRANHSHYAIADNFFQAAFGGSFLNHQWLIAARTPWDDNAPANLHSLVDSEGFPRSNYPLYVPMPGATYRDSDFTVTCPAPKASLACGNFAVNTMQPTNEPWGTFGEKLVVQTHATIGDRLTGAGVDWAWYSGGWSNAAGNVNAPGWTNGSGPTCSDPNHDTNAAFHYPKCPDFVFQFHHQPFAYFANYAPGMPGRSHLRDEVEFMDAAKSSGSQCNLQAVSFVKPLGQENEHPGYASEPNGSNHLVDLLKMIDESACAKDTMVIVTYDEFGGQWDHVPPPGQAGGPSAPHDDMGPGTRIPALVIAPGLPGNFVVDHTPYDTTSILATIEHRYGLGPLWQRDAAVNDLSTVWDGKQVPAG